MYNILSLGKIYVCLSLHLAVLHKIIIKLYDYKYLQLMRNDIINNRKVNWRVQRA